jgi:hypothetical protein
MLTKLISILKPQKPTVLIHHEEAQHLTRIGIPEMPELRRLDLEITPFTIYQDQHLWFKTVSTKTPMLYLEGFFTERSGKKYRLAIAHAPAPMEVLIQRLLIKGIARIKARQIVSPGFKCELKSSI